MKTKISFLSVATLFLVIKLIAAPTEEGQLIFMNQCAACHNVNKIMTGPALAGVDQRHSIDWIIHFVQSSQSVIKSGDKDAIALFEKFNKIQMPDHPDLSADDIKSVVQYIKSQVVATDTKAPFAKPTKLMTEYRPISLDKDYLLVIAYIFSVLLLIGTLLLAVYFKSMKNKRKNKEG